MKVILTFLITSLLWIGGYYLYTETLSQEVESEEQAVIIDYSDDIIGKWIPVEESECKLEFSKYGILKQYIDVLGIEIPKEFPYQVNKNVVVLTQNDENVNFPITIYTDENETFLEIRNITQLSGKYKKVVLSSKATKTASKPKQMNSVSKSKVDKPKTERTIEKEPIAENLITERPKAEQKHLSADETLAETPTIQNSSKEKAALYISNAPEELIGKWDPVEGAKHPIEISRYGAIIQWWAEGHNSRYQYSIDGDQIKIGYSQKGRYEITEVGHQIYLEIYNNDDFSGKYIKRSGYFVPTGQLIKSEDIAKEIVGRWQPVCGAKHPIEITKYGTVIQHWAKGHNSRYDYKLNGKNIKIGYETGLVEIIKGAKVYMELYDHNDFSGLYYKEN